VIDGLYKFLLTIFVFISLAFTACGSVNDSNVDDGSNSNGTNDNSDNNTDGSITGSIVNRASGMLLTSDSSPIAGATIILSEPVTNNSVKSLVQIEDESADLGELTDEDGSVCSDINVPGKVYSSDCTDSTGTYILSQEVPCGVPLKLTAVKNNFSLSIDVTFPCSESNSDENETDTIALSSVDDIKFDDRCGTDSNDDDEDSCEVICHRPPGNPDNEHTICVSPNAHPAHLNHGDYIGECDTESSNVSEIELAASTSDTESCDFDIAKIAVVTGHYDEIQNVLAKLGYGTINSSGRLDQSAPFDFTLIDGNNSLNDSLYDNFEDFVMDLDNLTPYDIIFINCGNSSEALSTNSTVKANLKQYVEEGGKLYVTDWAYMFLEQPFPDFMDFSRGGSDVNTPEAPITAAKIGKGGITSDVTVHDSTMANWLDQVYVNPGSIVDDCYTLPKSAEGTQGGRNLNGKVTIGDFLGGWVMMDGIHTDVLVKPKIWISGPVSSYSDSVGNAPLTVTRDQGLGRILYSSYHTAGTCDSTGFWPQERILQYLVFEL